MKQNSYKIIEIDPLLKHFESDINLRMERYDSVKKQLLGNMKSLNQFANGHLYYGFHKQNNGWIYREWAPNAEKINLVGDFNNWNYSSHELTKIDNGNWEIFIEGENALPHLSNIKILVTANGNSFERIPLYIKRVVQDPNNHSFCGQIWNPVNEFVWKDSNFALDKVKPLLIYESHIGMAGENESIASYIHFANNILPYVKECGYNTIQLMAIMEHPYYGSFGYQVSNFFAISSKFGTPDELKYLIDKAHSMGIAVLLDIVHSHAVKNTAEGINQFDGTDYQFFHIGEKGEHPAWGTKLFNYGSFQVMHFLLSNIKFWLDEYHFDGFRFDGVTSMLYHDHGLGTSFDSYDKYFSLNTDVEAITYLQLATELAKEVKKDCILISEDMSGMPGMCIPVKDGGIGFDYRLAMGMPDFWVNSITKRSDENWDIGKLWYELNQRRPKENVIGYCESHDQALVGDKTIIFRLADKEMYWHMNIGTENIVIKRAIALHKLIRLITCVCAGEGYLNFMGNEFGHPEWIDFPREGNGWSYKYARRQWSLAHNNELLYNSLLEFDKAMLNMVKTYDLLDKNIKPILIKHHEERKILIFTKNKCLFIFNFHPTKEFNGSIDIPSWLNNGVIINSQWNKFGGNINDGDNYITSKKENTLEISIPPRCALVLK